MFRLAKNTGDSVPVPQLLFSKLSVKGTNDARFRVALYIISSKGAEAQEISAALGITRREAEDALNYWEGAGLVERDAPGQAPGEVAERRRAMTTREVVAAGQADERLGNMLAELQWVFGTVLGEKDINLYATLYKQDGFPPDVIMLAAQKTKSRGVNNAKYVEKILQQWQKQGIKTYEDAERLMHLEAKREEREQELARRMGLAWDPYTLADKKKIAVWFEEYGFGFDMVEAARLAAGDKQNDVKYLSGILKKWYAKGYHTPKNIQQAGEGQNLRVQRPSAPAGKDLLQMSGYIPMKKRNRE